MRGIKLAVSNQQTFTASLPNMYAELVRFIKDQGIEYLERRTARKGALGLYYHDGRIVVDPTQDEGTRICTLLHEYGHHVLLGLPYMKDQVAAEWFAIHFALQTAGMYGGRVDNQLWNLSEYKWSTATEPEKNYVLQNVREQVQMFCLMTGKPHVLAL